MQMKDGQLFHILTYGQGSMTSFAAQLTPDGRWDVINYVRRLQQQEAPSQASAVEAAEADPTASATPESPTADTETEKDRAAGEELFRATGEERSP